MKKTPLNPTHKELGAKMVAFGDWEMPIQYTSIIQEHINTRTKAGLFDVSHMGEIFVDGIGATEFLDYLTCNNVANLTVKQVQYNAIMNASGGIVDDITIYKMNEEKYLICSNASNYLKVFYHLTNNKKNSSVSIRDESESWHQLAIQGPLAEEFLSDYFKKDLSYITYYHFDTISDKDEEMMIVSRTGYTGEDGFELYSSISTGIRIWKDLLRLYNDKGLIPVGLGARDTLRIEAKYPLYGHELTDDRSPLESGIGWIVKEKQSPYLGYDKIVQEKLKGSRIQSIGLELIESGVIREGCPVLSTDGIVIGNTTSGTYSPTLKKSIGLAIINSEDAKNGNEVLIEIRGTKKKAILVKSPFILGSVKKKQ